MTQGSFRWKRAALVVAFATVISAAGFGVVEASAAAPLMTSRGSACAGMTTVKSTTSLVTPQSKVVVGQLRTYSRPTTINGRPATSFCSVVVTRQNYDVTKGALHVTPIYWRAIQAGKHWDDTALNAGVLQVKTVSTSFGLKNAASLTYKGETATASATVTHAAKKAATKKSAADKKPSNGSGTAAPKKQSTPPRTVCDKKPYTVTEEHWVTMYVYSKYPSRWFEQTDNIVLRTKLSGKAFEAKYGSEYSYADTTNKKVTEPVTKYRNVCHTV